MSKIENRAMAEDEIKIGVEVMDYVIKEIGARCVDKAQCGMFAFKLRKHAPDLVEHLLRSDDAKKAELPFPLKDQITALEVAIFDNLVPYGGVRPKKGKKGHTVERYKAVLKVWTCPVKEINFQSQRGFQRFEVTLHTRAKLIEKAKKHQKSRPDLAEALTGLATSPQFADHLGGPLASKPYGEGTIYHGQRMLMIQENMLDPTATFLDPENKEIYHLPPFTRTDAAKRQLEGNVILQSRYAPHADLSNWRTGA